MRSPQRTLPRAVRRFAFRLILFYICSVLAIGVICPSNNSLFVHGASDAASSPFVIAIENAGIPVLGNIVNAAILTSAWSSANSYLYMSSRSLYSLAVAGSAPRMFKACHRWGIPYAAVTASSLFSGLAYFSLSSASTVVYDWLLSFTNTSAFISWTCCCLIFFRFRKAARVQGVEPAYRSRLQPYGAYIALGGSIFFALISGFTVFIPSQWSVGTFFTSYIGILAFAVLYLGHRVFFRRDPWAWCPQDIDLLTGLDEIIAAETPIIPRLGRRKVLGVLIEWSPPARLIRQSIAAEPQKPSLTKILLSRIS